jgi:hypothetical protein
LSLDSDNDGHLSRPQLVEAVQMVGLVPRDSLIRKYMLAGNAFLKSKSENFEIESEKSGPNHFSYMFQ